MQRDSQPAIEVNQIDLIAAIIKHLEHRHGARRVLPRQLNAVVNAANMIVDEFSIAEKTVQPGMGFTAWCHSDLNDLLASKDAKIAELERAINEALKQVGEWSRKCGLAEGRLAASEMAGVVEGWQQRAEKAEAELAREREISRNAIDRGDEAAAILSRDPNYRWTLLGQLHAVAELARLRLLLAPWSAESGECWQCHCQRRGMQHTNGQCRCSPEWKAAVRKA